VSFHENSHTAYGQDRPSRFKIDFLGQHCSQKSAMMNSSRNQNMDSWKSGNLYDALQSTDAHENMKGLLQKKKSVVKLVVPMKTYKDELEDKYRQDERFHEGHRHCQRTEGYNTLSNKTELGTNLAKTRMCNSVEKNETCRHGEKCRFAHSLKELVTRNCFFKGECRFVRLENGKLVNNGRDICRNKHPNESQDEFIERVGLAHYKTRDVSTRVPTHVQAPKVITLEKSMHDCDRYTTSTSSWASTLKASLKPPAEACLLVSPPLVEKPLPFLSFEKKEVVLRVPRELAMQALELAIKSGNTSIRVEVVE
jgi:hypothetical protein